MGCFRLMLEAVYVLLLAFVVLHMVQVRPVEAETVAFIMAGTAAVVGSFYVIRRIL